MAKKKKHKQKNPGQVIIPGSHPNPPEPHEVDAALILARHFQSAVEFLVPVDDYLRKSADVLMLGVEWEIKCPSGTSKTTIGAQFRRASKQASNIIIDTRRTRLQDDEIESKIRYEMNKRTAIKRVIMIDKTEKVIEIQR